MAAKELYIARHYMKKEKWIAAINRLKNILNNYDTTIYIEEVLHRLVEVHYIIGLENEAQKYLDRIRAAGSVGATREEGLKIMEAEARRIKISVEYQSEIQHF